MFLQLSKFHAIRTRCMGGTLHTEWLRRYSEHSGNTRSTLLGWCASGSVVSCGAISVNSVFGPKILQNIAVPIVKFCGARFLCGARILGNRCFSGIVESIRILPITPALSVKGWTNKTWRFSIAYCFIFADWFISEEYTFQGCIWVRRRLTCFDDIDCWLPVWVLASSIITKSNL